MAQCKLTVQACCLFLYHWKAHTGTVFFTSTGRWEVEMGVPDKASYPDTARDEN